MSSFDPENHRYDTVEEIPDGVVLALESDGTLYLKSAGSDEEWLSASLGPRNVSANTTNNR